MDVLFAKTRHQYDSYSDFWRLVDLSGFDSCFIDEMDMYDPNKLYISAPHNGEWNPHLDNHPNRTSKFMLWNLERPGEDSIAKYVSASDRLVDGGYFHSVITSDSWLAQVSGWKYVPLGSHFGLGGEPVASAMKRWDLIHLMCYSLRRAFMFNYLTPRSDLNGITIAPNGWGDDRHKSLTYARCMLNIHQDTYPIIEPIRFAISAAYGLPILSENCKDFFPYHVGSQVTLVEADTKSVIAAANRVCTNYGIHRASALIMREKMCTEYSFRRCIERYL